MEDLAQRASKNVDRAEVDLTQALSHSETKHESLEPLLAKFRSACQDYIFIDYIAAAKKKVEDRLWNAHSKVNSKFRPYLARFRDGNGQKLKVERRKAEKVYLAFIKSSQAFYRGYIQRVASNFEDIPEILSLAREMGLDTLSADSPQPVDHELKKRLIHCCYSALVQCGDLSRYRETELKLTLRNWGPAVGYYNKAAALDPADGKAYHQLAVIALADQDHLRGIYHLYQAICVETPFPQAQGNLELEFRKLRVKSDQGKSVAENSDVFKGSRHLYEQFILFHARCWDKKPTDQEELQTEILRLITDEMREHPEATILRKFSFINIAAEKYAADKVRDDHSALPYFGILQLFNVKFFSLLLKLVLDELRPLAEDSMSSVNSSPIEVPPVTRRSLSHLRLYSGWLLSTISFLLANEELESQMPQLWCLYAETLNMLLQMYPPIGPEIQYLLKEDGETLGFSAFSQFVRDKRFGKPTYSEPAFGPQLPSHEMLFRIKEIIRDAMHLFRSDELKSLSVPLAFAKNRFVYLGEGHGPVQTIALDVEPVSGFQDKCGRNAEYAIENGAIVRELPSLQDSTPDAQGSMASRMENMVDDLTRPRAARPESNRSSMAFDDTAATKTPVVQTFTEREMSPSQPATFNARDLVQRMQHSSSGSQPSPRPQPINIVPLPSIWNSPFAPRPGETPDSSPRPGSAHRLMQPPAVSSHLTSSAEFQTNLTHLKDEIQQRTSPQSSFQPTMSSHYDTPTNLTSFVRAHDPTQSPYSPSRSVFVSAVPNQQTPVSTRTSYASPFGAIGEPRPRSSRTPNSAQPG